MPMQTAFRPAIASDMNSIYLMGFDIWGAGLSEERYLNECRNSPKYRLGQWYCLKENGVPMSSLIIYKNCFGMQDRFAGFGSIASQFRRRGEGFATGLINECIKELRLYGIAGIYLHSETDSSLYERLGFQTLSSKNDIQLMFLEIQDVQRTSEPTYF